MQVTPDDILKYTEINIMGKRIFKEDAPEDIKEKAIAWEKEFFSKTSRRRIENLDIDENSIEFMFANKDNQ